jgi:hypothetical protein
MCTVMYFSCACSVHSRLFCNVYAPARLVLLQVCRGTAVTVVAPTAGTELIDNPFQVAQPPEDE